MATGLFLLVYVGAEVSAGGYMYAYAVIQDLATETSAAFLTSMFWGALTLGSLLLFFSMRVRACVNLRKAHECL